MIQWNPSNPDTLGAQNSVLISGVEKYTNVVFGTAKTVLYIEVSFSECPDITENFSPAVCVPSVVHDADGQQRLRGHLQSNHSTIREET